MSLTLQIRREHMRGKIPSVHHTHTFGRQMSSYVFQRLGCWYAREPERLWSQWRSCAAIVYSPSVWVSGVDIVEARQSTTLFSQRIQRSKSWASFINIPHTTDYARPRDQKTGSVGDQISVRGESKSVEMFRIQFIRKSMHDCRSRWAFPAFIAHWMVFFKLTKERSMTVTDSTGTYPSTSDPELCHI